MFATNWTGIKAAGLVRGAYHFFEPEENGVDQAQHFIDTVTLAPGDLPPMLDIEVADGETPERIATEIRVWLEAVKAHYGVTPIVYSDVSFIREDLANGFESYPLWLAEYHDGAAPNVPAPWTTWTLWQYTSKGQVDGVDGDVDQDRFVGAEAAWRTLLVK